MPPSSTDSSLPRLHGRGAQRVGEPEPGLLRGQGGVLPRLGGDGLDLLEPEPQEVGLPCALRAPTALPRRARPRSLADAGRARRVPVAACAGPPRRRTGRARPVCAAGLSSRCWSDWPWTATSGSTSSASAEAGTDTPPANARDRPSAEICRAISSRPSSISPPSSSTRSRKGRARRVDVDHALHPRGLRSGAHRTGVCAAAEQQAQGGDDHRLAGPGLAGDDGQSRGDLEDRLLDHPERGDAELLKHSLPPSPSAATALRRAAPAADRQVELRHQPVGEGCLVESRQADRRLPAAYLDPRPGRQVHGAAAVAPQDAGRRPCARGPPRPGPRSGATTMGRAKSAWALIGTISSASTPGHTIGPPALKL